jgi:hypothetical protein
MYANKNIKIISHTNKSFSCYRIEEQLPNNKLKTITVSKSSWKTNKFVIY